MEIKFSFINSLNKYFLVNLIKTAFCEYWTSIKIKIMTYVSKEYQSKTKMVQEQWLQLKMQLLLGYNLKIVIQWGENWLVVVVVVVVVVVGGGNTNLVGGVYWGEIFLGRGRRGWNEQIFSWGDSPPSPSRENPVKCSHI